MELPPYRSFFKVNKILGYFIGLNPVKHTNENLKYGWILKPYGGFMILNSIFVLVNMGLSFGLVEYNFLQIVSTISILGSSTYGLLNFIFAWRNCDKISNIVNELEEMYRIQWQWRQEITDDLIKHRKKINNYQYSIIPIHITFAYVPVLITLVSYLFMDDPAPRFPLENHYFYDKFQHVILTFFIELNQVRHAGFSIIIADCTLILIIIQLSYQFESLANEMVDIVQKKSDKNSDEIDPPMMKIVTLEQAFKLHLRLLK